MTELLTPNYYWLPFPGIYQCVLTNSRGEEVASGTGTDCAAAKAAAEKSLSHV